MRKSLRLTCAIFFMLAARSDASNSVGVDASGGVGTSGGDVLGTADFHVATLKNPFEAQLEFSHQHTTTGTESKTNQVTLGVSHTEGDHWGSEANVTYWKDTITNIHYAGPTLGVTYTWTDGSVASLSSKHAGTSAQINPEDHPSDKNETETEPSPSNEIASLSANCDLFFYDLDVEGSSVTRRVFNRTTRRFVTRVIPAGSGKETITQAHPSITVEKPLFDSALTPYLTLGHYFYSKDPTTIEDLTGRPRFAASATHLNGLVGGFLKNNGEIGIRASLPVDVDLDLRLGADQSVTDNAWSTLQGVTFSRSFGDHLRAKIDWGRSIQAGVSSDVFTGGLTYTF